MENVWLLAALWLGLALIATLLSIWFRISTALSEIVVGTVAQLLIGALVGSGALAAKASWVSFLAGTGAIVLTWLARSSTQRFLRASGKRLSPWVSWDFSDPSSGPLPLPTTFCGGI